MRRYPAFDPPEYVHWTLDEALLRDYVDRIAADPERSRVVEALDAGAALDLYRDLLRTRLHDVWLKRWVRTGVISKAWLGTGEEAVTVGTVAALDRSRDVLTPMIRNAGALHMMGMPLADMFRGYLGSLDSPSHGRDLHIGDPERGAYAPISHMGTNVVIMAGAALAFRYRGEPRVSLTWIGDGATKTAEAHEGINFAAVQRLPAIFVIQNNQVALGTRLAQHGAGDLHRWPEMYGVVGATCDGNNVLDVYAAARLAAERCRRGEGPVVLVADTFRMGGHATHDEREARETFPDELFRSWGRRDPIGLYEAWLVRIKAIDPGTLDQIERGVTDEMEAAAEEALRSRETSAPPEDALYEGFSEGGTLIGLERRPIQVEAARVGP